MHAHNTAPTRPPIPCNPSLPATEQEHGKQCGGGGVRLAGAWLRGGGEGGYPAWAPADVSRGTRSDSKGPPVGGPRGSGTERGARRGHARTRPAAALAGVAGQHPAHAHTGTATGGGLSWGPWGGAAARARACLWASGRAAARGRGGMLARSCASPHRLRAASSWAWQAPGERPLSWARAWGHCLGRGAKGARWPAGAWGSGTWGCAVEAAQGRRGGAGRCNAVVPRQAEQAGAQTLAAAGRQAACVKVRGFTGAVAMRTRGTRGAVSRGRAVEGNIQPRAPGGMRRAAQQGEGTHKAGRLPHTGLATLGWQARGRSAWDCR